ncbi:hypothetical protein AMATHDRAFT_62126 [Amanita thiersii Skay4041]|uniref:tRNA (adenine(58)-N(1))-methyltransferase catalytic subunit TRM61 n=1 Tax=Amanita thiersii Skay4041 TaxID=703135 RepID=A0A2A9NNQ5_9AGAR|nr:hypothetical protein AMATHDRAFT_62126 [Amanita thiersii Skay4041]
MALPHRTQILYLADIAFITSHLDLKHGSKVVEAGTGSGSFSHSIARTVGSTGHLWTYEFHEARAHKASEEFNRHGFSDIVTLTHRNVCKDGFTISDMADAVFLDLPAPWDAIEHAKNALRKDKITRICCFSPCIEQVLRTVSVLNEAGFVEITMYETLQRPHDVSQIPTLPSVTEAAEKLKQSELRREEKRLRQIAANKAKLSVAAAGESGGSGSTHKRKRHQDDQADADSGHSVLENNNSYIGDGDDGNGIPPISSKKFRTDTGSEVPTYEYEIPQLYTPETEHATSSQGDVGTNASRPTDGSSRHTVVTPSIFAPFSRITVSKSFPEVRGHTSYLTFACLVPYPNSSSAVPGDGTEEVPVHE